MSLKKIIIFGVLGYAVLGFILFFSADKNKEIPGNKNSMNQIFVENDVVLSWDIHSEQEGTYRAPAWLKNSEYINYLEENDFADDHSPTNYSSQFQLMSFIAQLQLGDPTLAFTFITPEYAYSEFETREYNEMEEESYRLASAATKKQQLKKVEIFTSQIINDQELVHHVKLYFNDDVVEISVPMKLIVPEIVFNEQFDEQLDRIESLWMINQTLTDFSLLVETASQN